MEGSLSSGSKSLRDPDAKRVEGRGGEEERISSDEDDDDDEEGRD